jgi:TonB-dependent SusC/RagA subfamily outer membrane receptor
MTSTRLCVVPVGLLVLPLIVSCARAPQPGESRSVEPRAESLAQMLSGRVSGVVVTALPGGGISVRISGPRSFSMPQEPLYVVDEVVVQPGPNGALAWLNPEDVASIEVLKYDSQTAMYGLRGGNGVIKIKTKGAH